MWESRLFLIASKTAPIKVLHTTVKFNCRATCRNTSSGYNEKKFIPRSAGSDDDKCAPSLSRKQSPQDAEINRERLRLLECELFAS